MERFEIRRVVAVAVVMILAAGLAPAQRWRDEVIREVGLQFRAPHYLERIPQRLGSDGGYTRARLEPKKPQDFVDKRYKWTVLVLEFDPNAKPPAPPKAPKGDKPKTPEEIKRRMLEQLRAQRRRKQPKSFKDWLALTRDAEVVKQGANRAGKGGKLDHKHWVWRTERVYGEAAVYEQDGKEVALVVWMPLSYKRGRKPPTKPSARWSKMINSILKSGERVELSELEEVSVGDDRRDEFANTDARRSALAAAKANIQGLKGWDYFSAPNYIVLYSWRDANASARAASKNRARYYSSRLERMRELYVEHYPLDKSGKRAVMPDKQSIPDPKSDNVPITGPRPQVEAAAKDPAVDDKKPKASSAYPVLRFCATEAQFQKYGQSPRGVVGWFSPVSKELVVFLGGDERMGKGATESVVYHEGWHQYADFYFRHPDRPKNDALHRWFDEGHGDYFGSFRLQRGKWRYLGSGMRGRSIERLVQRNAVPSLEKIVKWPRSQFYGRNAANNYAVAYALVDFLRRGALLRKHYKPIYEGILQDYKNVMLVYGDAKRATDTAFRKFEANDWRELQVAWTAWVTSGHFKDG
ncbi:MAG: hypothetical protein NXI31_21065 [bacterium]|nr:hypothetical protein [bacterium]